ncbi:MAG: hypothetical protein QOD45_56, partial [Pseudonocardiales bacterium]|nr:hypothetical protein [Pseudonocardiales bacterium]
MVLGSVPVDNWVGTPSRVRAWGMRAQAPPQPADHGPRLAPATRLLWRTDRSVQLELGSRAVVVDGLAPDDIGRLAGHPSSDTPSATRPTDRGAAVAALVEAGFLWPHRDDEEDVRFSPP